MKAKMILETDCKQCGRHIEHEANFIEYYCKCGNWIPILVFKEKKKGGGEMIEIKDIPRSKVIKVRYRTEEERERILKALEVLEIPMKTLKYTG